MKNWKLNASIFLGTQAISLLGSLFVQYAITWKITLDTQSGVDTMLMVIFAFVPTFVLSPIGGVWADRYNRKMLIALADGAIALCALILAFLFYFDIYSIEILLIAVGIRAVGAAVQQPCVGAILPDIVPEKHLVRINSINGTLLSCLQVVAPMIGGAIFGTAGLSAIFVIDVVTAVVATTIMLLFLNIPKMAVVKKEDKSSYLKELKLGLAYIKNEHYLLLFFIFSAIAFFLFSPTMFLTPLQTTRAFGTEVWRLTAVEVAFSIGMIFGGIVMAVWGGFKNYVHSMVVAGILMGLMTVGMGLARDFFLYLSTMVVCGFAFPIYNTPTVVLLQERVEPSYMGRVFGVMTMISTAIMPIAMLIFGPLADFVAIEWIFVTVGILLIVESLVLAMNGTMQKAGMGKVVSELEEGM